MPQAFDPGWKRPENDAPPPTLEDLMTSAPVHELHAPGKAQANLPSYDFLSLSGKGQNRKKPPVPLSFADYFIDFLTPTLIFVMMLSLILYLLDVRFIFTEQDDLRLRGVSIFFVLGVVALNRLVARDGKEQSMVYILLMLMVVTLFTLATSKNSGSYVPGMMDQAWIDLFFNLCVVGFFWWVTNRLTQECCVDKSSASGEVGIVQGTILSAMRTRDNMRNLPAQVKDVVNRKTEETPYILTDTVEAYDPLERDQAAAMALADAMTQAEKPKTWSDRLPQSHPGVSIFYVSLPVLAVFALGYPVLRNGGPSMTNVAYFFVGVYTLAALGLLMLTSLRGLRGYCQERGVPIPPGVSWFWMGFGILMVALVLLGGFLGPTTGAPETFRVGPREIDMNARHVEGWDYREYESSTNTQQPAPQDPDLAADIESEETGPGKSPKNTPGAENPGEGGSSGKADQSTGGSNTDGTVSSPLMQMMEASPVVGYAVLIVLAVGGACVVIVGLLFLARAIGSGNKNKRPGAMSRLRKFFEGLFAMAQVPGMRPWQVRMSRELSASAAFRNPMDSPLPLRDKVVYSYDALCALAQDVGQPRDPDRTPHEFMAEFPERLQALRETAEDLTRLYVIAEYSNLEIQPQVQDRLRKFWMRYDSLRGAVLR